MMFGIAAGIACFVLGSAFVVPAGNTATAEYRAAQVHEVHMAEESYSARFAAVSAASSVALAATILASLTRRRSSLTSYGFKRAVPVVDLEANFCGSSVLAHSSENRTSARYTTQEILPAFAWIDSGVKSSDLEPTQLIAKNVAGNDVLIGKTEQGALFCVSNLCPHIGTPMSEGADVIGDVIVCPLHGSSFSTKTGDLIDWCPSPPIIGPLTGLVVEKKNLYIFETRTPFFGGGNVEVQVDTNAKRAYEAAYWKGILDAQGKDDGTYY